jgi:cyclopropane-fatty-acyl-phospholipid synthase
MTSRCTTPRFYLRVLRDGRLGLGESYVDGQWDTRSLDELTARLIRAGVKRPLPSWRGAIHLTAARLRNLQSAVRARRSVAGHYDIGNDLYQAMLGTTLAYTCAYWNWAIDLDEAAARQVRSGVPQARPAAGDEGSGARLRLGDLRPARGEQLRSPRDRVHALEGAGLLGRQLCRGLPVELHLADYRTAQGSYDAVVSIGMIEHVGPRNHRRYMEVVDRCLAPGGIALIHTIGSNRSQVLIDAWFHRYVFPDAAIPSLAQLAAAMEGTFVAEDVHNIGPHYDRTLMAWAANFERAWPQLRARYGGRFRRLWQYYLLTSAGAFRARFMQLYQIVMTRAGTRQPECRVS